MKRLLRLTAVFAVLFAAHSLLHAWTPQVVIGQWTKIQPDAEQPPVGLSQARDGATAVLLKDKHVLIVGGTSPEGTPLASAELFIDGAFYAAMPMSVARTGH